MSKRILSLFMIVMLLMGSMIGCSSKPEKQGEKEASSGDVIMKKDLTIASSADIASLDPQGHNDTKSERVSCLLFNKLFKLNTDFKVVPDLAEKWSQPSDTEWVIKIKEGVKFHDGTEMTANDVKFSLERSLTQPKVQHVLSGVESIEVVDNYTVKIKTKSAFAPFLYTLVHAGASILPQAYVESGDNFAKTIGSGPYTFVEWASGDKVVLKKNEAYFDADNMGQMETITFRVIPEGTSRTIALETGEVDIVEELQTIDMSKVEENEKLALYTKPSTTINYFGMNNEKAPFDNQLVRQAMNYAIDKQAIMTVAVNGAGIEAKSVLAPTILGYKESNYAYDPAKAKELLAAVGYKDGLEISLWASGDERKRIAEVIQANLLEVGIQANIEMFEWGTYIDKLMKGEHQSFVLGWSSNPDPDATLTPLYYSESIGGMNFSRTNDKKVDKFILSARGELDLDKRVATYNEFHQYIMDKAPIAPLFVKNNVVGANAGLKDVELSPQGLWNIEKIHY
ncbi:ABC transporter substrate-binding protein [Marinisporobacter balticus]|uniref:Peptide/nickel transport system substrate-binding protein n=1 Tax=Marinisporobacter balticus TaxID=2018667 RepID=A0A4R2KFZ6_9FIRM|nr:ABC transporter substrate-binding protein [Marinisporobacter balticus]TCO69346.1 peptide/nickel transport system substrate-binding protein [Marinisporobacter balticus]